MASFASSAAMSSAPFAAMSFASSAVTSSASLAATSFTSSAATSSTSFDVEISSAVVFFTFREKLRPLFM